MTTRKQTKEVINKVTNKSINAEFGALAKERKELKKVVADDYLSPFALLNAYRKHGKDYLTKLGFDARKINVKDFGEHWNNDNLRFAVFRPAYKTDETKQKADERLKKQGLYLDDKMQLLPFSFDALDKVLAQIEKEQKAAKKASLPQKPQSFGMWVRTQDQTQPYELLEKEYNKYVKDFKK